MADSGAVFLDTTIQIARFVHGPGIKRRIEDRLSNYRISVTGLVVRQEFKRRLLKEAKYLLGQLQRRGSIQAVMRHVHDVLPKQQDRKRRICLQTLMTVFEQDDPQEATQRAHLFLRYLLRGGLNEFDELVGHVVQATQCACGAMMIRQKRSGDFDFGTDRCSKTGGRCGIRAFLKENMSRIQAILSHLKETPEEDKSDEIKRAETFLEQAVVGLDNVERKDPCLNVGDLLIALESAGIPVFFTMNGKESQHFCRALDQQLVVRRPNPDHEDIVCGQKQDSWPRF